MSGPATVKRGRGRPRKDGQPAQASKPKNPDCEPATKGYVKCIARTLTKQVIDDSDAHAISAVIWLLLTFGLWAITGFNFYQSPHLVILGALLFTLFLHDIVLWYLVGYHATIKEYPFMEKYIPPEEIQRICEVFNKPEKECEE